ncbi:MAG: hypothetical protein Q4D85_07715 [Corynebacterium sp.]|uniref:hypothetical protein n=1 Tax=Corynebacterium sp. TaxID=1720 RepID=UPI0026DB6527|nr:hypothetical protein [Corynebacterium sp.]MDO5098633.1 hypothetical protein [Corynebacterium sp.]
MTTNRILFYLGIIATVFAAAIAYVADNYVAATAILFGLLCFLISEVTAKTPHVDFGGETINVAEVKRYRRAHPDASLFDAIQAVADQKQQQD